jgi:hypothetical protein
MEHAFRHTQKIWQSNNLVECMKALSVDEAKTANTSSQVSDTATETTTTVSGWWGTNGGLTNMTKSPTRKMRQSVAGLYQIRRAWVVACWRILYCKANMVAVVIIYTSSSHRHRLPHHQSHNKRKHICLPLRPQAHRKPRRKTAPTISQAMITFIRVMMDAIVSYIHFINVCLNMRLLKLGKCQMCLIWWWKISRNLP